MWGDTEIHLSDAHSKPQTAHFPRREKRSKATRQTTGCLPHTPKAKKKQKAIIYAGRDEVKGNGENVNWKLTYRLGEGADHCYWMRLHCMERILVENNCKNKKYKWSHNSYQELEDVFFIMKSPVTFKICQGHPNLHAHIKLKGSYRYIKFLNSCWNRTQENTQRLSSPKCMAFISLIHTLLYWHDRRKDS